jgi:hypothetical protein
MIKTFVFQLHETIKKEQTDTIELLEVRLNNAYFKATLSVQVS